MNWTYIDEKIPPKSGQYLVAIRIAGYKGQNFVTLNEFDLRKKSFTYDTNMRERGDPTRVYAWAAYPTPPLHKSSILAKQNQICDKETR